MAVSTDMLETMSQHVDELFYSKLALERNYGVEIMIK